jgi:hypothetical protein
MSPSCYLGGDWFGMLFFVGDTIGVAVTPLLVRFIVRLDREHEVHEDEQGEDETLHEADEDLESDERDASPGTSRSALMTVSMISPPNTLPQRRRVSVSMRKISLKSSMSPTRMKIAPMNGRP